MDIIYTLQVIIIILLSVGLIYFHKTKSQKALTKKMSILDNAILSRNINKILFDIKSELNADNVSLFRFHNGGHYRNKFDMNRFTCVNEVYNPNRSRSMQDECTGVLIERYSDAMSQLMYMGEFFVSDIDYCSDDKFKVDAKRYGHNSVYLFLIKQISGEEEAFISVNFIRKVTLSAEQKAIVSCEHNRILNLLNSLKIKK